MEEVIPVNFHRTKQPKAIGVHKTNLSALCRMWIVFICIALGQGWAERISADPPRKLSEKAAERMIEEGDRFADQAEYLKAVQRYTDAYLGIVARLRGQDFAESVAPSLMTRKELADEMKRQMDLDYTEEELRLMEGTFKVFGLVPKNLDVKGLMTKLLTEEVGGFYDPRTKAMVLIRENDRAREPGMLGKLLGQRPTFDKEEQKITLAHELTHALQDQLYGLLQMQNAIEKDDDMSLAFSALVEGDATLVMFGEMGRQEGDVLGKTQMDPEAARFMFNMMKMMLPIAGGKTYRGAPPIFRDGLIFPYFQGLIFNLHMTRNGGFDRVHAAYRSPPVSSEQILHPAKYLEQVDEPFDLRFPQPESLFPSGWKHLGGNCLGEFQTSILLRSVRKVPLPPKDGMETDMRFSSKTRS